MGVVYCFKKFTESIKDFVSDGVSVVFDVFRASTTIIAALYRGIKFVVPVSDIKEGIEISSEINAITAGESGGRKIRGYMYSNSPAQMLVIKDVERPLVLRSTNGTRVIKNLENKTSIIIGALANSIALAKYLAKNHYGEKIFLIAVGRKTRSITFETFEDILGVALTAKYLKKLGFKLDKSCEKILKFEKTLAFLSKILRSKIYKMLVKTLKSPYLLDIKISLTPNLFNLVPVLRKFGNYSALIKAK